jgi:excisionase family DNA binding protein
MDLMDYPEYIYLPLMKVGEAARYLGVGRKIIYQLIEYEQLKAVRNNGAVRIEKRDLDEIKSSGIIP